MNKFNITTEQENIELLFTYINLFKKLNISDKLALEILEIRGIKIPSLV
jgi:hypothetical protein